MREVGDDRVNEVNGKQYVEGEEIYIPPQVYVEHVQMSQGQKTQGQENMEEELPPPGFEVVYLLSLGI